MDGNAIRDVVLRKKRTSAASGKQVCMKRQGGLKNECAASMEKPCGDRMFFPLSRTKCRN